MSTKASKLKPLAFRPLPLGSIRPAGWLERQLRIQANGLSGHLDEFWPDIADSGWIGGHAEGWERGPYWLDGVIPLALLLDDAGLKAKVRRWVEEILARQHEDGWLGPVQSNSGGNYNSPYDPWPTMVVLKALTQYHEATGDERVLSAIARSLRRVATLLADTPLRSWAGFRASDLILSAHWLYERTGEDWLLDLAALAYAQGYDWRAHFADFRFKRRVTRPQAEQANMWTHVVNNAMAVKAGGVWHRQSHDAGDRASVYRAMEMLDTYHGQATGIFGGDEHYAGKNPSQGTELCAVNEYLFSLEQLLAILGDPALADRLERIAFNALPGTFSADMWAHQYDQQANQVICRIAEDRIYTTNDPDSNIFGLEPNYGCCTANLSQGWPKFAAHLWMHSPDGGLAAIAYAPSRVSTILAGEQVTVDLQTDYPFNDVLHFTVHAPSAVRFPLRLRIPAWAAGATVAVAGHAPAAAVQGTFHTIEQLWQGRTSVVLHVPLRVRAQRRYHKSITLERGPLVFSLQIGEDWRRVGGELPHADWEVMPTTPWNYALQLDPEQPASSVAVTVRPSGDCPFSPAGAPVRLTVAGRRVPGWRIEHNAAGPLPQSPVRSRQPLEELTLIPYGSAKLRVTEFPLLA